MDNDTTLQKGKLKAKRKIKALDFSGANAAVALVSKDQGGAANGMATLLIKGANFSDALIEKMQQVRVTMELPDFLEKFFGVYGRNSQILAQMMGYQKQEEDEKEEPESYDDYIKSKLESFEIIKSLYEADSLTDAIAELSEDEYLSILMDQETLEEPLSKSIEQVKESNESEPNKANDASNEDNKAAVTVAKSDGEASASVNKKTNNPTKKGNKSMTTEKSTENQEVEVTKAQFESLTKAFEEQQVELQKAKEALAAFEEEKKQAVLKARKAQVLDAVKVEDKAEVIFKAVQGASDEDFQAVVKALKDLQESVEKSDLFIEKGASAHDDEVQAESPVAKILKAKLAKVK